MRCQVIEELKSTFRPEFLNRIDETIIFHRLTEENMLEITRTMLREVMLRFDKLGLTLIVPEDTVKWLARKGHDEKYGARPLRRTVQHSIEDNAAELLLDGEIKSGDCLAAIVSEDRIILSMAM